MGIAYAKELYIIYQQKVSELTEEEVMNICKCLKKLNFTGNTLNEESHKEALEQGTKLFELYLGIQRFVVFGQGVCPADCDSFYINNFYKWFHGGVAQWLEIAVYKALQRIEKAVELDNLVPVDTTVKYSSSAVDTLTIFYQVRFFCYVWSTEGGYIHVSILLMRFFGKDWVISLIFDLQLNYYYINDFQVKVFWQQLNWPDVEGCYTFIAKMIDVSSIFILEIRNFH